MDIITVDYFLFGVALWILFSIVQTPQEASEKGRSVGTLAITFSFSILLVFLAGVKCMGPYSAFISLIFSFLYVLGSTLGWMLYRFLNWHKHLGGSPVFGVLERALYGLDVFFGVGLLLFILRCVS
jgi:hypothetical protein